MLEHLIRQLKVHQEGQSMTEYALILGLIAVVVITILVTLGGNIEGVFQKISEEIAKVL